MIPTRSAVSCTSSSEWDERNTVPPVGGGLPQESRTSFCRSGSSPEVGSSSTTSSGPVHERLDEPDLLAVALRELADRAVEDDPEPLDERVAELRSTSRRAAAPATRAAPGRQPIRQAQVAREVADARRRARTPSRRVSQPEQRCRPGRRLDQIRAAGGSSCTCRRRSGRGTRRPRRARPGGRGRRPRGRRRSTSCRVRSSRSPGTETRRDRTPRPFFGVSQTRALRSLPMTDESRISRRDSLLKLGGLLAGATAVGGWKVAEEAGAGPAAVASGAVSCVLAPETDRGPVLPRRPQDPPRHPRGQGRSAAHAAAHRPRRLDVQADQGRGSRHLALRRRRRVLRHRRPEPTRASCAGSSAPTRRGSRSSGRSTRAGTPAAPCTST